MSDDIQPCPICGKPHRGECVETDGSLAGHRAHMAKYMREWRKKRAAELARLRALAGEK